MGSGLSKHPDETSTGGGRSGSNPAVNGSNNSVMTPPSADNSGAKDNVAADVEKKSGCPMHRPDGTYSYDWTSMFRAAAVHGPKGSKPLSAEVVENQQQKSATISGGGGCPVKHSSPPPPPSSGCPVKHNTNDSNHPEYNVYSQPIDKTNQMPSGIRNQLPSATQRVALSTERVSSTIPKGGGEDDEKTWTYPSPQQFYNALVRKGKMNVSPNGGEGDDTETASEHDMESVVALHNNMNEKTWNKILEWERQIYSSTSNAKPKLLRFLGRPHDLSPKAYIKHYLLGHPLPFDRHDWIILRDDNTTVRYIMDYYFNELAAKETSDSAVPALHDESATSSLLVDVRPALDTPAMLFHRIVTMPYKIYISKETKYQYLPMKGDRELSSQVGESIQVWQSIQELKRQQDEQQQRQNDADASDDTMMEIKLTQAQAEQVARNFASVLKECNAVQQRVQQCTTDSECQKASIDLTLCMGKILCPVQHEAFTKALMSDDSNDDRRQDELIQVSLETLSDCVVHCTAERQAAREQYPRLF